MLTIDKISNNTNVALITNTYREEDNTLITIQEFHYRGRFYAGIEYSIPEREALGKCSFKKCTKYANGEASLVIRPNTKNFPIRVLYLCKEHYELSAFIRLLEFEKNEISRI